ncbi:MAG: hypothetical protein ACPL4E_00820 [Thermoproteota archaeon]
MAKTTVNLKRRMLTLLKEDEEFRYAVIGLLGLEDLRSGQARLEKAQAGLQEAVEKLVGRQDALEKAVEKLVEAQVRTDSALQELSRHVGRLSDTIGFGLEDIARVVVPGWLYRHEGIEVEELVRKLIRVDGEEVEINLYGEGKRRDAKIIILGEAKSRIYPGDIEEFDKSAEKAKKTMADGVYKLMFGYYVHPSAEQEAERRGITLIASYMR